MKAYLTPDFIDDLKNASDTTFVRRALSAAILRDGSFRVRGQDDHRYRGIDDAWIRYISRGDRIIYIQRGEDAYLYRAGHHDVEDNLAPPTRLGASLSVAAVKDLNAQASTYHDAGEVLSTFEPTFLDKYVKSMYHKGHHEILLIAPFLSHSIFSSKHHFGRFLDRAIEEGTTVVLVTLPDEDKMDFLCDLEKREIITYVCPQLHAKLLLFDVNKSTLNVYNRDTKCTAIVGSANLTSQGLGFEGAAPNKEVCYRVPEFMFGDVKKYASKIIQRAEDPRRYWRRIKANRN